MSHVQPYVPEVQMSEAAEERQQAQHQAHAKTRQINRLPIEGDHRFDPPRLPLELFNSFASRAHHSCAPRESSSPPQPAAVSAAVRQSNLSSGRNTSSSRSLKRRRLQNALEQQQAAPRILMPRNRQQCASQLRIAPEPLRSADQPKVQLLVERRLVRQHRSPAHPGIPPDRRPGIRDAP